MTLLDRRRRVRLLSADGAYANEAGNGPGTAVDDALAAFDARSEIGVLGVPGRAGTVEELSELRRNRGVELLRWYGLWLLSIGSSSVEPS